MTPRSTVQRARIADENGHSVTYWGVNLTTFQVAMTLCATVLTILISVTVLVSPWVEYKARTVAEEEIVQASASIVTIHNKDMDLLKTEIKAGDEDRDEILRRLERLETKIDNFIAERRR